MGEAVSLAVFSHRYLCCLAVLCVSFAASCTASHRVRPFPRPVPTPPSFIYAPPKPPAEFEARTKALFRGIVAVYTPHGMGSGFVVRQTEEAVFVMTAYHVIRRAATPTVNGFPASVIAVAPSHDLAILRLSQEGSFPTTLRFAEPRAGQQVAAVGYSRWSGREIRLVHIGFIVSLDVRNPYGYWTVMHNAGGRGGLSGGPLLDGAGDVVGVNVFFIDMAVPPHTWNATELCAMPGTSAQKFLQIVLPSEKFPECTE